MMKDWQAIAFNQDPESDNQIHGDELAQQYGFQGGLVPGVTISAYLAHPAIEAWGESFLATGQLHVRVVSPLYDKEAFTVQIDEQGERHYRATLLRGDGTVSAHAEATLPDNLPQAPTYRGDPMAPGDYQGPVSNELVWQKLQTDGCFAMQFTWQSKHLMATYLRDRECLPAVHRGENALANMGYILWISNWIAATNVYMNPWVHLETHSQNFAAIPSSSKIVAEMSVRDLFDRGGHKFFDVAVDLFSCDDHRCLTSIELRAIYQLRGG